MTRLAPLLFLFIAPLSNAIGQRVQWWRDGNVPEGRLGTKLAATGDVDGDGIGDLLATEPGVSGVSGRVLLIAGRGGAVLRSFSDGIANSRFGSDATSLDDCNGDGVRDLAIGASQLDRVYLYSGASGAQLRIVIGTQGGFGSALCSAGDVNGDGRGDIAVFGSVGVDLISGANGAVLGSFPNTAGNQSTVALRLLPDLDADGHPELLLSSSGGIVKVLDPFPTPTTRVISPPVGSTSILGSQGVGFADLDGDGVVELLLSDSNPTSQGSRGLLYVCSPITGALLDTLREPPGSGVLIVSAIERVGDLDADGHDDVLLVHSDGRSADLAILFGRTREIRTFWTPSSQFATIAAGTRGLASLGDVNGNGYLDMAIGNADVLGGSGQCVLLDSRFLASSRAIGVGCGAGPFIPQLGISRPILGSIAQIVLRDAPPTSPGLLILSIAPRRTINLGVEGCDVALDFSTASPITNLAGSSSYTVPLSIPQVPQFAGLDLALQAVFLATAGPLGFDLSNGVWARIGY